MIETTGKLRSRVTACTADTRSSTEDTSARSKAVMTPIGIAPIEVSNVFDSRMAVPAVITSSMIRTRRPLIEAPTRVPPSPWSFASLRLYAKPTSTSKSENNSELTTAPSEIPLYAGPKMTSNLAFPCLSVLKGLREVALQVSQTGITNRNIIQGSFYTKSPKNIESAIWV
jgi:hypothetical protein